MTLCTLFMLAACDNLRSPAGTAQVSLSVKASLAIKVPVEVRRQAGALGFAPVIIRLNMGVDLAPLNSSRRAAAIETVASRVIARVSPDQVRIVHRYQIVPILSAWANDDGLAALAELPDVAEVVLDRLEQPSLDRSTRLINAHLVWPASTGTGRLVAVLDTGTDGLHPFVSTRVPYEACFRKDSKCPGLVPQKTGSGAARNMARGHGMHVAGIAAGGNASWGGVQLRGVAPGAGIIAINVFTPGGSYVGDQVKALEYVAQLKQANVRVVAANLSLGDGVTYQSACDQAEKDRKPIIDKLLAMGVATVVAAGNRALPDAVSAPGCITSAVTVSSVTNLDRINAANSRSALTDYMAPGEAIMSSLPHGVYGDQSGTSMAAPHVSGAIALLSAAVPQATLPQILAALSKTGKPLYEQSTNRTYHRIDVRAALVHLQGQ